MLNYEIEEHEGREAKQRETITHLNTMIREHINMSSVQNQLVYEQISDLERNHLDQITQLTDSLHRLELIKKEYYLLLTNQHPSPEQTDFLRTKEFNSYQLLEDAIQEMTKTINEREKCKQPYHFTNRLDASMADNAIEYVIQCEKVSHDSIKESVKDVNVNLHKYITEYGIL
jgi:uncharacterized coiled-coil protein SlyX